MHLQKAKYSVIWFPFPSLPLFRYCHVSNMFRLFFLRCFVNEWLFFLSFGRAVFSRSVEQRWVQLIAQAKIIVQNTLSVSHHLWSFVLCVRFWFVLCCVFHAFISFVLTTWWIVFSSNVHCVYVLFINHSGFERPLDQLWRFFIYYYRNTMRWTEREKERQRYRQHIYVLISKCALVDYMWFKIAIYLCNDVQLCVDIIN